MTDSNLTNSNTQTWVTDDPNDGISTDYFFPTGAPIPALDFFFSQAENVEGFIAWGYQTSGNAGVDFSLQFSLDGCSSFTDTVAVSEPGLTNRPSTDGGLLMDLGGMFPANCVRVNILDNGWVPAGMGTSGGDRVGLGEVRFTAVASGAGGGPGPLIMPSE
jgi:hypothetical protein